MHPAIGIPHTTPFGYVAVTIPGARLKQLYEARAKLHEGRARQADALLQKMPPPSLRSSGGGRVVPMRGRQPPAEVHAAMLDPHLWNKPAIERAADDERRMADHLALVAELLEPDRKYDVSEELILRLVGPVQRSVVDSGILDPSPSTVDLGDIPGGIMPPPGGGPTPVS